MADPVTFVSMNCQGLSDKTKKVDKLNFLKSNIRCICFSILTLQIKTRAISELSGDLMLF